jgi:hypothetical protein
LKNSRIKPDQAGRNRIGFPLVLIEWVDSSRLGDGWIDIADIKQPNPSLCVSVGFLAKANARGKVLIPTIADVEHADNRHCHGGIMIPTRSIIRERRLK